MGESPGEEGALPGLSVTRLDWEFLILQGMKSSYEWGRSEDGAAVVWTLRPLKLSLGIGPLWSDSSDLTFPFHNVG